MSLRSHILLMLVATLISWIVWLLVISIINPLHAQWWGFALFYLTFFLSLFGSFTVVGFVIRSVIQFRRRTLQYKTSTALRQAFLWSLALVIALSLQGQRLLTWWIMILIFIVFALSEFFILNTHKSEKMQ